MLLCLRNGHHEGIFAIETIPVYLYKVTYTFNHLKRVNDLSFWLGSYEGSYLSYNFSNSKDNYLQINF